MIIKIKRTKIMVTVAVLITISIVLTRLFAIQTPLIRASFEFIPVFISSVLFGPIIGGITAALADVLGMMLLPSSTFFPGFTISAFLSGAIYGIFLHNRDFNRMFFLAAILAKILIVDLICITIWLSMLYGTPWEVLIVSRLLKIVVLIPVELTINYFIITRLIPRLKMYLK